MLSALRRSVERKVPAKPSKESLWTPSKSKLLVCDSDLDNVPIEFEQEDGSVFFVSQSRSAHKRIGQDSIGTATEGNWLVRVLCDGHDQDGHLVARMVSQVLPKVVLRKIIHREGVDADADVEEKLLIDAFDEAATHVTWTGEGIRTGMFVRIFGGLFEGKVGYVGELTGSKASVIIVDELGYHKPTLDIMSLKRARFTGGSTCICFVTNNKTGSCRVAFTGDSRSMLMNVKHTDDAILKPCFGLATYDDAGKPTVPPMSLTTPAHNVFSKTELLRLNEYEGSFEIDGAFLVNAVTKFAIQPTRGIGDTDMFGTGYSSVPECSKVFNVGFTPGGASPLLFCASDGIFDEHVWKDDELVSFFAQHMPKDRSQHKLSILGNMLYKETLERSLAGGYVDDISFWLAWGPELPLPEDEAKKDEQVEPEAASQDETGSQPRSKDKRKSSRMSLTNPNRKSLLHGLWTRKKEKQQSKLKRAASSAEDDPLAFTDSSDDEDTKAIAVKPKVAAPTKEDRRKTVDRKERTALVLSNMLKEALAEQNNPDVNEDDPDQLANIVLQRYASQYGHDPDQIDLGREVHDQAAQVGMRLSLRRRRKDSDSAEEDE